MFCAQISTAIKDYVSGKSNLKTAQFGNFRIFLPHQILREINFLDSRSAKTAILRGVNFVDLVNFGLKKDSKWVKMADFALQESSK